MGAVPPVAAAASPLLNLIELARRTRKAGSAPELRFLLVNDTHALSPYRQAGFWVADRATGRGIQALSGVIQVEANAPYAVWLDQLMRYCAQALPSAASIRAADVPEALSVAWAEWLPEHVAWLPLPPVGETRVPGALMLARDHPWTVPELGLLNEWVDTWSLAWRAMHPPAGGLRRLLSPGGHSSTTDTATPPSRPWWRRRLVWALAAPVCVALLPVRLSVLAPGELVPARPEVIRAPLDGVIDAVHVQPNQTVKAGQPLFSFDQVLLRSRLEVSRQALATADAEYRQAGQLALSDAKSRGMLAVLTGRIEEKRAEAEFSADQMQRAHVGAPTDGVVLFDDPSDWIGKPVSVGERIMRIAAPDDVEVEAWLGLGDAIPLPDDAVVSLHLNASPLAPVHAQLRYFSHDAVQRPDGSLAYRVRARLLAPTTHRVGLKGTARLNAGWVPLAYLIARRPWAAIRSTLGW